MSEAGAPPGILAGLRIVEVSAFVAAPLGGATLASLGADVIRVDPVGGGIDAGRWPLHNGRSLYWAGLNQGKRSVALDTRSEEGRQLLVELATAPGPDAGIVLTNLPVPDWFAYPMLAERRPDMIMLVITGNPDGSTAVDYTVNAALGFPYLTGPDKAVGPVNHVLPAWDALAGYMAVTGLLAAERHRRLTGNGQLVELSLADVGLSVSGHLGFLAEAELLPEPRRRLGNSIFGTFGRDFRTADGRDLMVVALTPRQWRSLVEATGLSAEMAAIESDRGLDLSREGDRWGVRVEIADEIQSWIGARPAAEVFATLDRQGVLWGPYQTLQQLVRDDPRCSPANPMFARLADGELGSHLVGGAPLRFSKAAPVAPRTGPRLGEHGVDVLRSVLGLADEDLDRLRNARVVG